MKPVPVSRIRGRGVLAKLEFWVCYCAALVVLVWVPLLGAGQGVEHANSIKFLGHRATTATGSDLARGANGASGSSEPVPIPGGLVLPPVIHVFAPGPVDQGFQGSDIEPSVITNYRGFSAIGYPGGFGTATDSVGNSYDLITDMRVFQGEYVSADGTHHRGTFAFI